MIKRILGKEWQSHEKAFISTYFFHGIVGCVSSFCRRSVGENKWTCGWDRPFPIGERRKHFRSADNNANWIETDSGLTATFVHSLAVIGGDIFAGTDSGVFRSANNGAYWTAANSGLTNTEVYSLVAQGVFLSSDNGASWTAANSGLTDEYVHSLAVICGDILAGTDRGGVFLSTDNGKNWNPVLSGVIGWSFAVIGGTIFAGTMGSAASGGGVRRRHCSGNGKQTRGNTDGRIQMQRVPIRE